MTMHILLYYFYMRFYIILIVSEITAGRDTFTKSKLETNGGKPHPWVKVFN